MLRVAVTVAGLALLTACGAAPRSAEPQSAPVAVPSAAPEVSPTTAVTDPVAKPVLTKLPTPTRPTRPTTTTRRPVITRTPVDSNAVVGPFGWQTLHLGMSYADAEALGVATPMPEGGMCEVWPAVGASALESVVVHPEQGVFAILPKDEDWLHTPEGMHVGWTTAQVQATYPDFDPADAGSAHGATVTAPGNPAAVYRMEFSGGVLVSFQLELAGDLCLT